MFLKGEKSHYIKEEHHHEIFRLFPNADIQEIKNAGHWLHADQPGLFVEKVAEFIESLRIFEKPC